METIKLQKGYKFIKNTDDMIIRDIQDYFQEPKIYLEQNNRIIIGKTLLKKLQNITNTNNEEHGNENNNINKDKNKYKIKHKRRSTQKNEEHQYNHFRSLTEGNKRPLSVGIHYLFKTTNEILNEFKEGKKREENEIKKGTDNLIPNNVIDKVKNKYIYQEKKLKRNLIENEKDNHFFDYLAYKCKTKKENLLCNNIEYFRVKNQFLNFIENNKNLYEKFGNHCWLVDLRRPNKMKKPRRNFINTGNTENDIWEPVIDTSNNVEIIKKVEKSYDVNNNYEKFFKENYLYKKINESKDNKKIKKTIRYKFVELNDINKLIIKGKNIISLEKDNFLKYGNKSHNFRVFKDPREENNKYCKNCTYKTNYTFKPRKIE